MEPKKNPKYDVHKKSKPIFFLSLSISISLVLTAFNWTTIKEPACVFPTPEKLYQQIEYVSNTEYSQIEKTQPKPAMKNIVFINPIEGNELANLVDEPVIEIPTLPINVSPTFDIPDEPIDHTFIVVEKMPVPQNGYESFYKLLGQETIYPRKAIQRNIAGKVFVEFVVSKNGELTDIKVIRGIGFGCDEEAIRVVKLSKWEPGKQRGIPVNVRMTIPIQFKIQ